MSYDLIGREDGLALSRMANRYGIGVLVAVLAAEADGRGDRGTARALRAAGVTFCGHEGIRPEIGEGHVHDPVGLVPELTEEVAEITRARAEFWMREAARKVSAPDAEFDPGVFVLRVWRVAELAIRAAGDAAGAAKTC